MRENEKLPNLRCRDQKEAGHGHGHWPWFNMSVPESASTLAALAVDVKHSDESSFEFLQVTEEELLKFKAVITVFDVVSKASKDESEEDGKKI